jgi:hypothetical protein
MVGVMKEKDLEKLLEHQTEEIKREIGVLKEHFDDKVEVIAEQYSDIKATLDEHTRILTANQEVLLEHDRDIKAIKSAADLRT